jgi:hypothetical protein
MEVYDYDINNQEYEMSDYLESINHYIDGASNYQTVPNITDIDYNLHNIEWIHDFIMDCNFVFTRIDMNTNIIYIHIINRLKEITAKYFEIKDDIGYGSLHYLHNPEDFFDEILYCRGQPKFWFKKYNEATTLLNAFELMSYTIYNYNEEKIFDNN